MRTPIQEFLQTQTSAQHVVEGGLTYLTRSWEKAVEYWEGNHDFEYDEMLNDCDGRELLGKVMDNFELEKKTLEHIESLDSRFKSVTEPDADFDRSEVPTTSWWYGRKPRTA